MDTRINGLRFVVEGGGGDDAGRIPISDCDFMSIGLPSPSPPPTTRMASDNFMSLKKKDFHASISTAERFLTEWLGILCGVINITAQWCLI